MSRRLKPKAYGVFHTVDRFTPLAAKLRREYDLKFRDPLTSHPHRFVWDYWHIPREYTVLRTPAYHYFTPTLYNRFHHFLVEWGRQNLGCHDVSPPWLSYYIEGCKQEPHRDAPHGPLAFVFSLTKWSQRKFSGGETFLRLTPRSELRIEPEFNRLTLFNPSVLHGVREVEGTHDPREARLVIHGWFVQPRPFWIGPMRADQVRKTLDRDLPASFESSFSLGTGLLSVRLRILPDGNIQSTQVLANTLLGSKENDVTKLVEGLKCIRFPKHRQGTVLTLPLICQ